MLRFVFGAALATVLSSLALAGEDFSQDFRVQSALARCEQNRAIGSRHRKHLHKVRIKFRDQKFLIYAHPLAFSPLTSKTTENYLNFFPFPELGQRYPHPTRFLDVGCGIGASSVLAASFGASVWALDINPAALGILLFNAYLHEVGDRVQARQSDVFSAFESEEFRYRSIEPFDIILCNLPPTYVEETHSIQDNLDLAFLNPGYRSFNQFFSEVRKYLKKGGRLYISFSRSSGDSDLIDKILEKNGFRMELVKGLHPKNSESEKDCIYGLFRLVNADEF